MKKKSFKPIALAVLAVFLVAGGVWAAAKINKTIGQGFAGGKAGQHGLFYVLKNGLLTDITTLRTNDTSQNTLLTEIVADHATIIALEADLKTLTNDIRTKLQGDYIITTPTLAIGSTNTAVSNVAFDFLVNGAPYAKAAVAAGTAPGNDVIPTGTYGAVALDIGTDGTIDAVEATGNATGYASAALAADHARMGYVTASKSDGAFTFGTTALNAASTTVAYTNGTSAFAAIGAAVATSPPATLTNGVPTLGTVATTSE